MDGLGSGAMSRASGLSPKALRLYDANGLLRPAHTDPATGYRRYSPEQLARARTIAELRRLELPLAVIAEVLDAPPHEMRDRLLAWWDAERAGFAERSRLVDALVGSVDAPVPRARVRIETMPARTIATLTRHVDQAALVPTIVADAIGLRDFVARGGGEPLDEHWVVYHEPVGDGLTGRIEVCVPYRGRIDPDGDTVLRREPAARWATTAITAGELVYPRLLAYYRAVHAVADEHGGAAGSGRERYAVPWSDDPDAVVADIAVPLVDPPAA